MTQLNWMLVCPKDKVDSASHLIKSYHPADIATGAVFEKSQTVSLRISFQPASRLGHDASRVFNTRNFEGMMAQLRKALTGLLGQEAQLYPVSAGYRLPQADPGPRR